MKKAQTKVNKKERELGLGIEKRGKKEKREST